MLMTEYDYDTDVAVQREEAAEQKAIETAKNGLAMNLSYEQISKLTGLSLEMLQSLAREWGITPNVRDKFKDSFLTEYDYDTDIAVQREEAAEQKAIETAKNFIKMGFSLEQVAQGTGLPLETVQKLVECR